MSHVQIPTDPEQLKSFIHNSYHLKPSLLKIDELGWKFGIRAIIRGENLLIRGDSGIGKTLLAYSLPEVLGRPQFIFNLGATQDPRTFLIGKTHADAAKGTYFVKSAFIHAIETENAVVVLDELSRAHPAAHNILMTVLDQKQRFVRIDEDPNTPTINVAKGVTFVATANVGSEYTTTLTLDRALVDRFSILMMEPLDKSTEMALLSEMYPDVDLFNIKAVAEIADDTRKQVKSNNPRIDTIISTRITTEIIGLIDDGFTLDEAAKVKIYPFYTNAGGDESPRTYMQQLVQKYITKESKNKTNPFKSDPNKGVLSPWG